MPRPTRLPQDVQEALGRLAVPDAYSAVLWAVAKSLERLGFGYATRFWVRRPGGRLGWIDLFALREDVALAIEIDRRSPRRSSVEKLRQVPAAVRVILLRGDDRAERSTPEGVDLVLPLHLVRRSGRQTAENAPRSREPTGVDTQVSTRQDRRSWGPSRASGGPSGKGGLHLGTEVAPGRTEIRSSDWWRIPRRDPR